MRINKLFIATIFACASAIASGENLQSGMKVSDKLKAAWDSPEIKGRIERGIEQNRKGDFKITFDKPVENLKVSLLRHEFVFGAPTMAIAATQDENGNIDMQRVKNMKKRLRKKLHKGEFRELGFSFDAKFKADTEMSVVEEWLQELAGLLNDHSLEMGGGWNSHVCGGFITRERGSVTPEDREIVRQWFDKHGQNLETIAVGELKDAWYGW